VALSQPVSAAIPSIIFPELSHHANASLFVLYGIVLLAVVPMATVCVFTSRRKLNINVPDRKTRLILFPAAIISQTFSLILFMNLGVVDMTAFSLLCLIVTLVIFAMNFWAKASIHSAALAGSITALVFTFGSVFLPAYLLLLIVVWSRRDLRIHTLSELIMGALVGLSVAVGIYRFVV
jgi:hypothetical protein